MSFSYQFFFELLVIFNDAVVRHPNIPFAVRVRMAILFSYPTVRCPARVTNPNSPFKTQFVEDFLQIRNLSLDLLYLNDSIIDDGHPCLVQELRDGNLLIDAEEHPRGLLAVAQRLVPDEGALWPFPPGPAEERGEMPGLVRHDKALLALF